MFPLNPPAFQIAKADLPFHMAKTGFKYLGIKITHTLSNLYKENIRPLTDFQKWSVLHLPLAGKVSCIKMNVLPRFLYLFQCIPIFLPKSFFKLVYKLISEFL